MQVLNFEIQGFKKFLKINLEDFKSNDKILVLGVAEGGIPVAEIVFQFLKNENLNFVSQSFIKSQRPSTRQKKKSKLTIKSLQFIFSITPKFLLDHLRIREHKKLSKRTEKDLVREISFDFPINFSEFDLILIVDDAVDSGASMKNVVDFVKEKTQNSIEIKSLSVVVTQKNPILLPDYFWKRDVLIRFPWSLDGKK